MNRPFTLKQCLLLCIPALLLGLIVRVALINTIPEAFYGPDSNSYFNSTAQLWLHGDLSCDQKRRWTYPLLIAFTPLLPLSPARSIPLLQHALGLVSILGLGWIVGNLTSLRLLWVPLVASLFAVWPRVLWYEHELVAESLFLSSFIFTVALAMPLSRLKERNGLFWFLVGAAVIVSIKPHGRGLWLGCVLFAALATRNSFSLWDRKCWGAVAAAILLMVTSGSSSQGNWLLLSSTLPLVKTEGKKWESYRQELRPVVEEARNNLGEYAWNQKIYKKRLYSRNPSSVSPAWAELAGREAEFSKVCKSFAREAILAHPIYFAQLTLTKIALAFSSEEGSGRFDPKRFWRDQNEKNVKRWKNSREELEFLYGQDETGVKSLSEERSQRRFPFFRILKELPEDLSPFKEGIVSKRHFLQFTLFGWLALLGFGLSLAPSRFTAVSALWIPSLLYLGTVFAVGDRVGRYVLPVEWVLWILIAIGLDVILRLFISPFVYSLKSRTAAAAEVSQAS